MEGKMENFDEVLRAYTEELENAKQAGLNSKEAKIIARDTIEKKFGGPFPMYFWSRAGIEVQRVYHLVRGKYTRHPKPVKQPAPTPTESQPTGKAGGFKDIMRAAALTGFIPKGKFLQPFVNGKSEQIHAYISQLRGEFTFTPTDYGWTCVSIEKPKTTEELIAEHNAKMLAALKANDLPTAFKEFTEINILTGKS